MPVLGVTGGIATGKSSFTNRLLRCFSAELFDADRCAHELLSSDAAIQLAIVQTFGADVCDLSGKPDRVRLRALVFDDPAKRRQLEQILHPVIRDRWLQLAERKSRGGEWLVVDIPLLFETGAEKHCDRVAVVACTPATQRRRLRDERGLSPQLAEQIISSQLDLETKTNQAHHVIWNDSTVRCLERQAGLFAALLRRTPG